jgi:hypothetical protein
MDLHHRSSQHPSTSIGNEVNMARTNFQYEKRQRELEKKRKAEEKARRKQDAKREAHEGPAAGQPRQEEQDGQDLQEEPAPQHAA